MIPLNPSKNCKVWFPFSCHSTFCWMVHSYSPVYLGKLMPQSNESASWEVYIRVSFQYSGQTNTKVAWEWMRVHKCLNVFLTLMCWSNENKSWYIMTSENLYESFLNSHILVKREQVLHESWWELKISPKLGLTRIQPCTQCLRDWLSSSFDWDFSYLSQHGI